VYRRPVLAAAVTSPALAAGNLTNRPAHVSDRSAHRAANTAAYAYISETSADTEWRDGFVYSGLDEGTHVMIYSPARAMASAPSTYILHDATAAQASADGSVDPSQRFFGDPSYNVYLRNKLVGADPDPEMRLQLYNQAKFGK